MRYVVLTMIMVLSCVNLSAAQMEGFSSRPEGLASQRGSLHGLPGVQLVVEAVQPDAEADGLSTQAIQTAAEKILQSSGIWVLTGPERIRIPSAPYLYVNVNTTKSPRGTYSFSIVIQLNQAVTLLTAGKKKAYATTWSSESTGYTGADNLPQVVPVIEEHIKRFTEDFLAVNPR